MRTKNISGFNNGQVYLRDKYRDFEGEREKINDVGDGWIKLRQHRTNLFLNSNEDGKVLNIRRNAKPCHGNQPCLR